MKNIISLSSETMSKKTLLCLDQGEHLGGAERFFAELLTEISDNYDIHLVTGKNTDYLDRYKDAHITFHHEDLPALKPLGISPLKKLKSIQKKLSVLIDEVKPDVIISNTVRTHVICSALAKKMKIPLVWMGHDLTFPKPLLKWFLKYPQALVSCSRHVGKYYLPTEKNSPTKHLLYPYGVQKHTLEKTHLQEKLPIIGMVGKFIPWKGQDLFIQMAAQIHQEVPEAKFVIIGDSYADEKESVQYYDKCLSMIQKLGLSKVLEIHKSNDVLEEISSWEILVHCSREPEPLGRVILEGMTAGCAVVASDMGGPVEIVHDDDNAVLCKPSLSRLVHTIGNLIKDDERRHRLQKTGKQWIRDHFMWKSTKERFMKIVDAL